MALKNNLDIKVQLLAPSIAEESYNAQRAIYEAAFHTNFSLSKSDQPVASALDVIEGTTNENIYTQTGVDIPLQTGGNITFDLADSRTKTTPILSVLRMRRILQLPSASLCCAAPGLKTM
jgi:hypothetical protein